MIMLLAKLQEIMKPREVYQAKLLVMPDTVLRLEKESYHSTGSHHSL